MVNWMIVALIAAMLFVMLLIVSIKVFGHEYDWIAALGAAFCGVTALVILLVAISYSMEYKNFEASFEIQRQTIAALTEKNNINSDNLLYMADMVEANKQLAEMQASKRNWKNWSMYPDSVLDIKPIGLD
jgi:hypothetical protein